MKIQPKNLIDSYYGFISSQAITCAIELGIFAALETGSSTFDSIRRKTLLHPRPLKVILDALVALKLVIRKNRDFIPSLEAKNFLLQGSPYYIGDFFMRTNLNFKIFSHLTQTLKSGRPLPSPKNRPRQLRRLVHDIYQTSHIAAGIAAEKLKLGGNLCILDIACGSGAWGIAFCEREPSNRCTALDLPEVIPFTRQMVRKQGLLSQFEFKGSNLFSASLGNNHYDLILLGNICRALGEKQSELLIRRCFQALKNGGKIVIGEWVRDFDGSTSLASTLFALHLLMSGTEGEVFEFRRIQGWLRKLGFRKISSFKTLYPIGVLKGEKP